jgi:ubiquinone/menaquinone biosynthesis C-methylase UbiE
MSLRTKFFAVTYDRFMRKAEQSGLAEMRASLLSTASGDVLEIGGGTGANLAYYPPAVTSLVITEPDPSMLKRLQSRVDGRAIPVTALRAPAEDLPFDDDSFDTVVSTLVLCGVDDQPRAARELRRVLRPSGQLLFLEHVRAQDPKLARHQDRLNWLNRLVVLCDCNRATQATLSDAGFDVSQSEPFALPASPSFVRPGVKGRATQLAAA